MHWFISCAIVWQTVFVVFGSTAFGTSSNKDMKVIWFASLLWPLTLAAIPVMATLQRRQTIRNLKFQSISREFPNVQSMDMDSFKNGLAKIDIKKLKLFLKLARSGDFNLSGPQMVAIREELISRVTEKALLKD